MQHLSKTGTVGLEQEKIPSTLVTN